MSAPAFYVGDKLLALGARLGRGGEGDVYLMADGSDRVVKIYHKPDALREAKIRTMVDARLGPTCPNVAVPIDIVRSGDGRFVGFSMTAATGCQPIHQLTATGSRRQHFPHADFRFIVRTATNLARIVAGLHAAGVVIGDINSSGILVSNTATITLIDADSFQIGRHRCRVGVPETTPPEMQGRTLSEIARTTQHDGFGLAVVIFQLLALGRHPYAGVGTHTRVTTIETAIARDLFAYSDLRTLGYDRPRQASCCPTCPERCGCSSSARSRRAPNDRPRQIGYANSPCWKEN